MATPIDESIIQKGIWVKIIKTYCKKFIFKTFIYAKKIGKAITTIIHPAEIKTLYILNKNIVSNFTGAEKRKSVSLLKYNTDMDAAMEESIIISEKVI